MAALCICLAASAWMPSCARRSRCRTEAVATSWRWDASRAGVRASTSHSSRGPAYRAELLGPDMGHLLRHLPFSGSTRPDAPGRPCEVYQVDVVARSSGRVTCRFPAHDRTSFVIERDRLYWLDFDPGTQFCRGELVAIDLRAGQEMWRTPLAEPCAINHSLWLTEAWLEVQTGRVVVYVREQGRPSARVTFDAASGRRLAVRWFGS